MATINGTNNGDNLNGTDLADQIFGLGGNDILIGFDGDDVLEGGAGADELFGSSGFDFAAIPGSSRTPPWPSRCLSGNSHRHARQADRMSEPQGRLNRPRWGART